jgi:pimeloyl-ACP methyl ester carboxylesterase
MKRLQLEYLFEDRPCPPGVALSDYDMLDVVSHGSHIYGEILWPDGGFTALRPCVVMFHGFPGSARNDDVAHALCRIGCVVLTPHHRGSWGSEGEYLVSNCVEDALVLAEYVHSGEFCAQYNTDPDSVYFIGHSMGGNTALQAARQLPWLRGLVLMTPFDVNVHIRDGEEQTLRGLMAQGSILRSQGVEAIFQDLAAHRAQYAYTTAYEQLKDQNILFITGQADQCAPGERMIKPLWELLQAHETAAVQRFRELPANHGLLGCRTELIRLIAAFLEETS